MRKFISAAAAVLLMSCVLTVPRAHQAATADPPVGLGTEDPSKIFTDPDFTLDRSDPELLEQLLNMEVLMPDANLKKAILRQMNPAVSGETILVRHMFDNLPVELSLNAQKIEDLTGLEYAVNVKGLSLRNNAITDLSALRNLFKLESLDYSYNKVQTIPAFLFNMHSLDELAGTNNNSTEMARSSLYQTNLIASLTLDYNQLTLINNLELCTWLETFSATNNKLDRVPSGLVNLTSLRSIALDNNQISTLPDLSGVPGLLELTLSSNAFTEFPASVFTSRSLYQLRLDHNSISAVPEDVGLPDGTRLPDLEILLLSFNRLTSLPPALTRLSSLKVLDVNVNAIDLQAASQVISALNSSNAKTIKYQLQAPVVHVKLYKTQTAAVLLRWDAVNALSLPTEGSYSVKGLSVQRREETLDDDGNPLTTAGAFSEIAQLPAGSVEYTDSSAAAGASYTYRVVCSVDGVYDVGDGGQSSAFSISGTSDMNTKYIADETDIPPVPNNGGSVWIYVLITVIILGAAGGGAAFFLIRRKRLREADPFAAKPRSSGSGPQRPGQQSPGGPSSGQPRSDRQQGQERAGSSRPQQQSGRPDAPRRPASSGQQQRPPSQRPPSNPNRPPSGSSADPRGGDPGDGSRRKK